MRELSVQEVEAVSGGLTIGDIFPSGSLGIVGKFFDNVALFFYLLLSGKTFNDII